jgi:type I restriction enzyme S subunit
VWTVRDPAPYMKIASTEWIPFFPVVDLDPDYLRWYLSRDHFRNYLASEVSGVGGSLMRVRPSTLDKYPLVLAPVGEQHRIVEAIESHFTRLDSAVTTLERVKANLKRYRASVLNAAVEGRLVPTEVELARKEERDYESASALLERILKKRRRRWEEVELAKLRASGKTPTDDRWTLRYAEPVAPDTANLPDLPSGWCWATVDCLAPDGAQNGLYVPRSRYGQGVPILRIEDYQTDWSRASDELKRVDIDDGTATGYALRDDDIVINRVNSPSHLGKTMVVESRHMPAVFESNMMRLRVDSNFDRRFLCDYLNSTTGKRRLTVNAKWAVNQASINQEDVARTAIPIPPLREQHRIADEVERLLSEANNCLAIVQDDIQRTMRLGQSILNWAYAGKLVDHNPTDEPAAAMLERIKAERQQSKANGGGNRAENRKRETA